MLGGIQQLLSRRRVALVLGGPMLVATVCGSVGTVIALPSSSARAAAHHHAPAPLRLAVGGSITPRYLRSLPHDERASVGGARFKERPPRTVTGLTLASAAIPGIAVAAYQHAQSVLAKTDPACHLGWFDLAGIGRVESDNGLTWGSLARVSPNGTLSPPILGPVLDGRDGEPAYPTPDHGILEHGGKWERAVGPMQFLPSTWSEYAQDGNGDGVKNPQNYWDAALTTAVFLCANGGNMNSPSGYSAGVLAYNHSTQYVALVRLWTRFYARAGAAPLTGGSDLLPVGYSHLPTPSSNPTHRGATPPSPSAVLLRALLVTSSERTYSFSFDALAGGPAGPSIGSGTGRVDVLTGDASMSVDVAGTGWFSLCDLASGSGVTTYVEPPVKVDEALREPARSWIQLSPGLRRARPLASAAGGLAFASSYLRSTVAALAGSTPAMAVAGQSTIDGVPTTAYSGPVDLALAAGRDAGARSDLDGVMADIGASDVQMTAWVDRAGLLRQLLVTLPRIVGVPQAPLTLEIRYGGFGSPLSLPTFSPAPYPPTSTTTTTSTSTTTTTSSSTTTTSTSTTTTSTTVPPTTS